MNRFPAILAALAVPLVAFGQGSKVVTSNIGGLQSSVITNDDSGIWIGKPRQSAAIAERNVKRLNGKVKHLSKTGLMIVDFGKGGNGHQKAKQLRDNGTMKYLVPNRTFTIDATPDDTLWSTQLNMTKIEAPAGWNVSTGSQDIVVAVIDTGIWTSHPDLTNNIWTDPVSGAHGWTCLDGVLTEGVNDENGHGTHCAGTIGAVGNNALGVAGINWKVKIAGFKFLNVNGSGSLMDVLQLIDKIIELKGNGVNIRVTSNSWGAFGTDDSLRDAFQALEDAGILNVVAAGNSSLNIDVNAVVPAGMTNHGIICVQATDANDYKATFSNYGLASTDIAAPGVHILSTMMTNAPHSDPSGYGYLSGTSMACPHVAGLAALALSVNTNLTVYELKGLLLNHGSVDTVTGQAAISTTSGRINVYKTLTNSLISSPVANHDPTNAVTATSPVDGGDTVTIDVAAGDQDGDSVTTQISSAEGMFSPTITNHLSFAAPPYGMDFVSTYSAATIDGNGGAAIKNGYIVINSVDTPAPFAVETCFDPDTWAMTIKHAAGSDTNVAAYFRAYITDRTATYILGSDNFNTYQVDTVCQERVGYWVHQVITNAAANDTWAIYGVARNAQGTIAKSAPVILRRGTDTNLTFQFPVISVVLTNSGGVAPATIGYDLTGSTDPDGTIKNCMVGSSVGNFWSLVPAKGTMWFDTPGSYMYTFQVQDNDGFATTTEQWIIVKPTDEEPPEPPPIGAPASLRILTRMNGYNIRSGSIYAPPTGK